VHKFFQLLTKAQKQLTALSNKATRQLSNCSSSRFGEKIRWR